MYFATLLLLSVILLLQFISSDTSQCPTNPHVSITYTLKPNLSSDNSNTTNSTGCCKISGNVFLCNDLDDAFSIIILLQQNISTVSFGIGLENSTVTLELEESFSFNNYSQILFDGLNGTNIICTNNNSLTFNSVSEFVMKNMLWTNCGTTSGTFLYFDNCTSVEITGCQFIESSGSSVKINNTDSIDVPFYSVSILDCVFIGSGLHISSSEKNTSSLFIETYTTANGTYVAVKNTHFINNNANNGGAVTLFQHFPTIDSVSQCLSDYITFHNCKFLGNTAILYGGAIYHRIFGYTLVSCFNSSLINFNNCSFRQNMASHSVVMYSYTNYFSVNFAVSFNACDISYNILPMYRLYDKTVCTTYFHGLLVILKTTNFTYNQASALCLEQSAGGIKDLAFIGNHAYSGAGISLTQGGLFFLFEFSTIKFLSNRAIYGGGIYQGPQETTDEHCIIVLEQNGNYTTLNFTDNMATAAGSAIYISTPTEQCNEELHVPDIKYVYIPDTSIQVATKATNITFLDPIEVIDGVWYLNLTLGESITINAIILDYYGNVASLTTDVLLTINGTAFTGNADITLNGLPTITIGNGTTLTNLFFTGKELTSDISATNYSLIFVNNEDNVSPITVILNFLSCQLGYYYNTTLMLCMCVDDSGIICGDRSGRPIACIEQGYWYGEVDNGYNALVSCSTSYCKSSSGECDTCTVGRETELCILPNNQDEQCAGNRAGILCTQCKPGYSFTYGAFQCEPSHTCTSGNVAIVLLLSIAFPVILIILVIVTLKYGYRITSGYMYCFIYYFSIVQYLIPPNISNTQIFLITSLFESFTQVRPQFLGRIPICFSSNISPLNQLPIQYLYPIITCFIVLAIIFLVKYCPVKLNFSHNTPVRAITILSLLSFTSLTETSIKILNLFYIKGVDRYFIAVDPSLPYFQGLHILWSLIAISVEVFIIFPFALLLLFAPLLMRRFNLTKIKPFLDEFQGCYKENFRWMAGFYFLCRQVYLIILLNPTTDYVFIYYMIQMISIGIVIFHTALQPYTNKWLNISDTILLAGLAFIPILYGETADAFFSHTSKARDAIVYILVFIPVLYLVILISMPFISKLKTKYNERKSYTVSVNDVNPESHPQINNEDPIVQMHNFNEDREPLIHILQGSREYHDNEEFDTEASYHIIESPIIPRSSSVSIRGDKVHLKTKDISTEHSWLPMELSKEERN